MKRRQLTPAFVAGELKPGKYFDGPLSSSSIAGEVSGHVTTAITAATPIEGDDAYSIAEFCAAHGITLRMYAKLREQKIAPREFRSGAVSHADAAAWRREHERATAENQAADHITSTGVKLTT
jgi:hypothetical protein